jgi:DNA-binding MarR family transcriptional regulator
MADGTNPTRATRANLGFRLAKASQRWNELLYERFVAAGYPEVRPSCGSILIPLFEEDGLRIGELAARARLSKQTMTTMVRLLKRDGLVERRPDPKDGRAARIYLTKRSKRFAAVVADVLAELEALVESRLGTRRAAEIASALAELMELG